jgi:hypothetical protein
MNTIGDSHCSCISRGGGLEPIDTTARYSGPFPIYCSIMYFFTEEDT